MRRGTAVYLTVAMLALPSVAMAQSYVWLGGAASIPTGKTSDGLKTGWLATVGAGLGMGASGSLSLNAEGIYGSNNYKVGSGKVTLYGAFLNLEYDISPKATIHPYVYAGGGGLRATPDGGKAESKGAYQAGAGLAFKLSQKTTFWGEGRYLSTASGDPKMTMIPITFGFSWSFGS
jgi:opacity protein-like surface antigen